jgi:hypothetical protein
MNSLTSRLFFKKPPHQWLCGQIAALRGTHNLAVYPILSRFLRSVRPALYPTRSLMRWFLGAFLLGLHLHVSAALSDVTRIFRQTPSLSQFEVCHSGGCAESNQLSINNAEWRNVAQIFSVKASNATEERVQISKAIGEIERIVGAKNGTSSDLAGTFDSGNTPGQLDCNDEAINTTTYMRLLKSNGLMQFHEIEDTRTRNFFFTGWPHSTAVIRDIKAGERYAVDSWFYDNGHVATIVPFATWKANYQPEDSPVGKVRAGQPANSQASNAQSK